MQGIASIRSPAKLNLHLEVQSKRDDGYHSIVSIFQMIGLYDEIRCRSLIEKNVCRIIGMPDIPENENVIYKAADVFRRITGIDKGVMFEVKKRIPPAAGLGGGSGNAAMALKLLNTLFKAGLSESRIRKAAEDVGSDVPFFCGTPCALVTGRGEALQQIKPRRDLWCLLVVPDFSIGTSYAYRKFDDRKFYKKGPVLTSISAAELTRRYLEEKPENWGFYNSFEFVLQGEYPRLTEIIRTLKQYGSKHAALSGSGSSCFGIFQKKEKAVQGLGAFSEKIRGCWVVPLLDKSPCTVLQ